MTSRSTSPLATRPVLRSLGASTTARLVTFPVSAVATLATTSISISYTGAANYAVISVVATLAQLLPFSDLGIGAGVINAVATTSDDPLRRRSAIASALRILMTSALVLCLVGIAGATLFSWHAVLGVQVTTLENYDWATAIALVLLAVSIPLGIGQRILIGLMRNPIAVLVAAIVSVASLGITVLVAVAHLQPELLVLGPAVGQALSALVTFFIALRLAHYPLRATFLHREYHLPGLLRQGAWYLLASLMVAATLQSGRIVLATRASLGELAGFALTMQFYLPLWSFFVAAGTALWPVFSARRHSGQAGRGAGVWSMAALFAGGGVIALAGLVVVGPGLAALLSRGTVHISLLALVCCGLLIVIQAVQLVLGVYLTTPDDFRFQALWSIPMALCAVGGAWALGPALGAAAPFLSAAVGMFCFSVVPCFLRIQRAPSSAPISVNPENLETEIIP